jgi:hypothetical protein
MLLSLNSSALGSLTFHVTGIEDKQFPTKMWGKSELPGESELQEATIESKGRIVNKHGTLSYKYAVRFDKGDPIEAYSAVMIMSAVAQGLSPKIALSRARYANTKAKVQSLTPSPSNQRAAEATPNVNITAPPAPLAQARPDSPPPAHNVWSTESPAEKVESLSKAMEVMSDSISELRGLVQSLAELVKPLTEAHPFAGVALGGQH